MRRLIAAVALAAATLTPTPAHAASGCATWGCGRASYVAEDAWYVTAYDTNRDGWWP